MAIRARSGGKTERSSQPYMGVGNAAALSGETGDRGREWWQFEHALGLKPGSTDRRWSLKAGSTAIVILIAGLTFGLVPLTVLGASVIARAGQPEKAIPIFDFVLRLFPADRQALAGRAAACETCGKYGQALADLNNLVDAAPNQTMAHVLRADLLSALGQKQAAQKDLALVRAQDPALALIFQRKSFASVYAHDSPDEIIRLATLALTIDANLPKSYANRAAGYLRQGRYGDAIDDATAGLALRPQQKNTVASLYSIRAESFCAAGQIDKAIRDARLSLAAYQQAKTYRELTLYCLQAGDFAAALAADQAGLDSVESKDMVLHFLRRQIYSLTKDKRVNTVRHYKGYPAIKVSEYFLDRADVYLEGKNFKDALSSCLFASASTPDKTTVLLARGRAYLGLGRYNEAMADFNKCLKTRPGLAQALYFRAQAGRALGQLVQARADSDQCCQLGFTPTAGQFIHVMQDYLP